MDNKSLLKFLRHYFHHSDFKNETQKTAITTILKRNSDVFVSFPSGYGRSISYLLPSLIYWNKMAIVIIPLLSRITQQINNLRRFHINAEVVSSLTTPAEKLRIYGDLQSGTVAHINFLYVTPDQVSTLEFKLLVSNLMKNKKLSYIIVDEAHCENQWIYGQKNTEYHPLGRLKKDCKDIPWIVATATAGVDVIDFLRRVLYIRDDPTCFIKFSIPVFRPNIYYDVIQDDIFGISIPHLTKYLEEYLNGDNIYRGAPSAGRPSGLIFCKTRQVTEQLAKDLKENGISIAAYHSGLEQTERNAVRNSFMKGFYQVLTVTSLSGMEINKPSIRVVVHWGLPSSISAYYNETGQAGKDGHPARCRIFLTKKSTAFYNEINEGVLVTEMNSVYTMDTIQKTAKRFLVFLHSRYMKDYCEGLKCRHKFISEYFGDVKMECIDKCDICSAMSNDFYGGRSSIRLELLQMGMSAYIKNICSKYQELEKNNLLTATDALNIIKVCDQLVKANKACQPEATVKTLKDHKEPKEVKNVDVEPLPSSSLVENDDKKDEDSLPSS
ncbi:ATP-dependent DNA helicase Q5-like [Melanaphis sacchari]|uniref:ATP-dependent DNA helicase n=1 Tax=Melanaphis sacchari TaxID=742174 RepID=A0A2H8TU42_9HEMI|nr:ATP-dependent DNA helicase Q5-like [Melanaphis sacchari]